MAKPPVLKTMPAAGGEIRDLYTFTGSEYSLDLVWSADGKYLLFSKLKGGVEQDYQVPHGLITRKPGTRENSRSFRVAKS